jgi:hypothetical protein
MSRITDGRPAGSPLPGSLRDLVAQAQGRPIYCVASHAVHPTLMATVLDTFRREFPLAEFVNARGIYRHRDDRRHRWRAELDRHGAGIVVTRGEGCPKHADPFAGLTGEHAVGISAGLEIQHLVRFDQPVGWHPVVFPATYWLARFAVEPFAEITSTRYARLVPLADAKPFRPVVGSWPPDDDGLCVSAT